jgi:O-antigen ligase
MMRKLLLAVFIGLMAEGMFGWDVTLLPGVSLKNAMLYLLVGFLGIQTAMGRRELVIELPQIHILFVLLLIIALLNWAANSLVGMYVPYTPVSGLILWKGGLLDHYLFFLVFFLGARSESDVLWLQKWILLFIAAGNIITVMDIYNFPDLGLIETTRDQRVKGPIGEANQYGVFIAMFLPLLVAKAWTERGAWRVFFTLGVAASVWTLLMTVSRGAFLAVIVGSLASMWMLRARLNPVYIRRALIWGLVLMVGAMLVLGQQYVDLIRERTLVTVAGADGFEMTAGRTWIWSSLLGAMFSEPWSILTGYGWGTSRSIIGFAPHNVYLDRFFELGLFGLLSFIALMYSVLLWTKRAVDSFDSKNQLTPGLIGFYFGFMALAVGIFSVDLGDPWYFVWAYTGLAMRGVVVGYASSGEVEREPALDAAQRPVMDGKHAL